MLFNSYEFIFAFLPAALLGYFLLQYTRSALLPKLWLVGSSLFFYAWWEPAYLPILLFSVLFNFGAGSYLNRDPSNGGRRKKSALILGVAVNVLLLGYYKYAGFLAENLSLLTGWELEVEEVPLPLAISFFTFQQIAYLVDAYKGAVKEHSFLNYLMFVTFFPQLIAGPIVHHSEMMPQFARKDQSWLQSGNLAQGLFVFVNGLFKKVIIADTLAVWATKGFDVLPSLSFGEAWFTSLSYTFQLYFDFSGYTDMAIGIALMFNIRLPFNFNAPYRALDIQDFWRRWHITLSRFLRDYIYIPLGGNKMGAFAVHRNILITFLIGGIWHGAGWTFLFWGFLHGVAMVVHRVWSKSAFSMPEWAAWSLTFLFVNFAWVFFRATSWGDAMKVLKGMVPGWNSFGFSLSSLGAPEWGWALWGALLLSILLIPNTNSLRERFTPNLPYLLTGCFLALVALLHLDKISQFIYFGF